MTSYNFGYERSRIAAQVSGRKVLQALARLERWHISSKFSPDQPRAPAGAPDGGQWIGEGAGAAIVELIAGIAPEQLEMSVQSFISAFCKGNINEVLPSQFLDEKIGTVSKLAKSGDAAARTCMKLLSRGDYRKGN